MTSTKIPHARHNAYRFTSHSSYANGFIPIVKQPAKRVALGD
jgi:hypothetical protein